MRTLEKWKREKVSRFCTDRNIRIIAKDKNEDIEAKAKKHWQHKPYKNDFGGGKSDTDR
jgi:hypothetical protein